jgi:hypothetical protein
MFDMSPASYDHERVMSAVFLIAESTEDNRLRAPDTTLHLRPVEDCQSVWLLALLPSRAPRHQDIVGKVPEPSIVTLVLPDRGPLVGVADDPITPSNDVARLIVPTCITAVTKTCIVSCMPCGTLHITELVETHTLPSHEVPPIPERAVSMELKDAPDTVTETDPVDGALSGAPRAGVG